MPRYNSEEEMVFAFDLPHKIGSICGPGCKQCGRKWTTNATGTLIPDNPFFILRKATANEWLNSTKRRGNTNPAIPYGAHFYVVSTD